MAIIPNGIPTNISPTTYNISVRRRVAELLPFKIMKSRINSCKLNLRSFCRTVEESKEHRGACWPIGSDEHFSWGRGQIFRGYGFPEVTPITKDTDFRITNLPTDLQTTSYATRMPGEVYILAGGVNPKRLGGGLPLIIKYNISAGVRNAVEVFRIPLDMDTDNEIGYYGSLVSHINGRIYAVSSRYLYEIIDEVDEEVVINRYELWDNNNPKKCMYSGIEVTPEGYLFTLTKFTQNDCDASGAKDIAMKCGTNDIPSSMVVFSPDHQTVSALLLPGASVGAASGAYEIIDGEKRTCLYASLMANASRTIVTPAENGAVLTLDENWMPEYSAESPVAVFSPLGPYMVGQTNSIYSKSTPAEMVIITRESPPTVYEIEIGGGSPSWFPAKLTCDNETGLVYTSEALSNMVKCFQITTVDNEPFVEEVWKTTASTGSFMNLTGPPEERQLIHTELIIPELVIVVVLCVLILFLVCLMIYLKNKKTGWLITTVITGIVSVLFCIEAYVFRFGHIFGGGLAFILPKYEWAVWRNARTGEEINRVKVLSGMALGVQPSGGGTFMYSAVFDKSLTIIQATSDYPTPSPSPSPSPTPL